MIFFYNESKFKSKQKFFLGGGGGAGVRVSEFFSMNPNLKKEKNVFCFGREGGGRLEEVNPNLKNIFFSRRGGGGGEGRSGRLE